jgi:Mg2+ and Co2+ transporter CorA
VRSRHVTTAGAVEVTEATTADALCTDDGLVWVDLDHTDEQAMALLPQLLDARPTDVEDCDARTPVPKLHLYPDHHYTAINGLSRGSNGRLYFQPLKVFQNPHLVITVLGPTSSALPRHAARRELDAVHHRLDDGRFRPTNSLALITAIRREMMGTLEHLIGDAAARIAAFEKQATPSTPCGRYRSISAGMASLCVSAFPSWPMPGKITTAAMPGRIVSAGMNTFGYAPMIGVSRADRVSFAAMARWTSAKLTVQ